MSEALFITRVWDLPEVLSPNTIYLVRERGTDKMSITAVGVNPDDPASTISVSDVEAVVTSLLQEAANNNSIVYSVATIPALWDKKPTGPAVAYVADTSGDPTADGSSGMYIYNVAERLWIPMPGTAGANVRWDSIIGRPMVTSVEIENAVHQAHNHKNKSVLDNFSDVGGRLLYGGKSIGDVTVQTTW